METLEKIVSENLVSQRKKHGWTQAELAEKIHYSDKSVSKWERGEALPDLKVLVALAELYGVTVDYFTTENPDPEAFVSRKSQLTYQVWATALMVCIVWFIATMVYTYGAINQQVYHWQMFIWALPASFLLLLVFSYRWFGSKLWPLYVSCFSWTLITAVYLEWLDMNMWMLYLVGIPAQLAIIMMAQIKRVK